MDLDDCECGHALDEHDQSLADAPCDVEGCDCAEFEDVDDEAFG